MKLLLDTHVFLWWRLGSSKVRKEAREAIASADVVWISAVSGWEAAIKQSLGKLTLTHAFADMVEASAFMELPLTLRHVDALARLPRVHPDPFDRMLIAQAQAESATLVTHDEQFRAYAVPVIWT